LTPGQPRRLPWRVRPRGVVDARQGAPRALQWLLKRRERPARRPGRRQLNLHPPATDRRRAAGSGCTDFMLIICLVIFVAVFGVMFYSILKHRKSVGHKAANFHESVAVEIAWTVVPFSSSSAWARWPRAPWSRRRTPPTPTSRSRPPATSGSGATTT
jgi:hypothetical protein